MSTLRPRSGVMEINAYVGGKSSADDSKPAIKLSANESAVGASPKAMAAFRDAAELLLRYPDGDSLELRQAIARRHNIDPASIVCGAGSDELISLLCSAFTGPGDEVLHSAHGFLMYRLSALAAGARPVAAAETSLRADVDNLLAAVTSRTRIVFIANPNNPTGSYLGRDEIARLHQGLPDDVLLVIDAAYAEFVSASDYEDGMQLALTRPNVVMTRTFSKLHGLAALRLGWMVGDPFVIDVMNRVRGPFNVNIPAQQAGKAAIDDVEHQARARAHNDQWLPWLTTELRALGLKVYDSVGNFVLVEFPDHAGKDADAAASFMEAHGVIPRGMRAYGLPNCLRISIGTEAENREAVAVLAKFCA